MVIVVSHPAGFRRALRYNEHKVERNQAKLIQAGNFLRDTHELTFNDKVQRFQRLVELNRDVRLNALHVSLNFHPDDRLSREKLIDIAAEYMLKIGFDKQPYLVYQHTDTVHPHLHVLSTNIGPEGNRIPMFELKLNTPVPIYQQLEAKFDLIRAEKRERSKTLNAQGEPTRANYGSAETSHAISEILGYTLPTYNYTSLTELNAVLRQYNLRADNGVPGGSLHGHRGLLYWMLDDEGKVIGRGIKASFLDANPGLKYLEERFRENSKIEPQEIRRLSARVEQALYNRPDSWAAFTAELQKQNLQAVPYMDEEKRLYSLVIIDYQKKIARGSAALDPSLANDPLLRKMGYDRDRDLRLSLAERDQRAPSRDITRAIEFLGRQQSVDRRREHGRELEHDRER